MAPSLNPVATPGATPTHGAVTLAAILDVDATERFETFGGQAIPLRAVWSPPDLGLGGTCLATDSWLECGLQDWMIQSSPGFDHPMLDLFFTTYVRHQLGRRLEAGEGPFDVLGQFGHPASDDCQPENRDECRDVFVVTAIDFGD